MLRIPLEVEVWEACRKMRRTALSSVSEGTLVAVPQTGRHGWMAIEYRKQEVKKKDIAVVVMAYPRQPGISRYYAHSEFTRSIIKLGETIFAMEGLPNDFILQPSNYDNQEAFIGFLEDIRDPRGGFWRLGKGHGVKGWFPKTEKEKPKPEQPRRPGPIGPLQGPRSR